MMRELRDIYLSMCGKIDCAKCPLNFVKGDAGSQKCVRIYLNDMVEAINNERS